MTFFILKFCLDLDKLEKYKVHKFIFVFVKKVIQVCFGAMTALLALKLSDLHQA